MGHGNCPPLAGIDASTATLAVFLKVLVESNGRAKWVSVERSCAGRRPALNVMKRIVVKTLPGSRLVDLAASQSPPPRLSRRSERLDTNTRVQTSNFVLSPCCPSPKGRAAGLRTNPF